MRRLTEAQLRGLIELAAACDERIRYGGQGYVRTHDICGTPAERSTANLRSLVALGLAEGFKHETTSPQQQWTWRITPAGREALRKEGGE